jgi:hypothetical protein
MLLAVKWQQNPLRETELRRDTTQTGSAPYFPGLPLVLMAHDSRAGRLTFVRKDIVNLLASIDVSRIAWQRFTFH